MAVEGIVVRGRAVVAAYAVSSFHAEAQAALLGLRLARSVHLLAPPRSVCLISDAEGLVTKIVKNNYFARDSATREVMEEISGAVRNMHNDKTMFSCIHKKASYDPFLEQVDYLSKTIGLE